MMKETYHSFMDRKKAWVKAHWGVLPEEEFHAQHDAMLAEYLAEADKCPGKGAGPALCSHWLEDKRTYCGADANFRAHFKGLCAEHVGCSVEYNGKMVTYCCPEPYDKNSMCQKCWREVCGEKT